MRQLHAEYLRWTPHPVIVTIMDNRDYIRVLLYSYYTTITVRGVLLRNTLRQEAHLRKEPFRDSTLLKARKDVVFAKLWALLVIDYIAAPN